MLYSFAIIIVTIVGMVGVLGKGLLTGILCEFDIDNGGMLQEFYTLLEPIIVNDLFTELQLYWDGVNNGNVICFS